MRCSSVWVSHTAQPVELELGKYPRAISGATVRTHRMTKPSQLATVSSVKIGT